MLGPEEPEDIFQLIAFKNGPLLDYHPVNLSQCLVWGKSWWGGPFIARLTRVDKIELVKRILVTLANDLKDSEEKKRHGVHFRRLDPSAYFTVPKARRLSKLATRKYDGLFDTRPNGVIDEDEDEFNDRLVADLIERLDGQLHLPLSYSEKALLATVAQATLEGERQRRALDLCGFRYLISIRMYVNQNRRSGTSGTVTPASGLQTLGGIRARPRLSFRNIVWATHSESQDVLLQAATECCPNGKMTWSDAKLWGAFLWLRSADAIVSGLLRGGADLTAITVRGHCPKQVHGGRRTRSDDVLAHLLRPRQEEHRARSMASGSEAQGAGDDAQVSRQRFPAGEVEDGGDEECLCSAQQAALR
jgi:hypothetical protein